jgi:hypothetical protein
MVCTMLARSLFEPSRSIARWNESRDALEDDLRMDGLRLARGDLSGDPAVDDVASSLLPSSDDDREIAFRPSSDSRDATGEIFFAGFSDGAADAAPSAPALLSAAAPPSAPALAAPHAGAAPRTAGGANVGIACGVSATCLAAGPVSNRLSESVGRRFAW